MFYWVMKRVFLGPVLRTLFRPWVKGLDNIPAEGAAIIASNHLSFSDSIFMPLMVPRPVIFLAKSEYFTGTGLKGRLTALFFRLTNQLPMDRSGGAASAASLEAGMDVLTERRTAGDLPRGHPQPRLPAVPGQGGRGAAGAPGRGAGDPGGDDRNGQGPADRQAAAEHPPHRHDLRRSRWTSAGIRAWRMTG